MAAASTPEPSKPRYVSLTSGLLPIGAFATQPQVGLRLKQLAGRQQLPDPRKSSISTDNPQTEVHCFWDIRILS